MRSEGVRSALPNSPESHCATLFSGADLQSHVSSPSESTQVSVSASLIAHPTQPLAQRSPIVCHTGGLKREDAPKLDVSPGWRKGHAEKAKAELAPRQGDKPAINLLFHGLVTAE